MTREHDDGMGRDEDHRAAGVEHTNSIPTAVACDLPTEQ